MKSARIVLAATLVAAAAHPALAGVVYAPAANMSKESIVRKSQIVLSNQDTANTRGVSARFIEDGLSGVPVPTGVTFPTLFAIAGGTTVRDIPLTTLPAGKEGMLEIFPGRFDMIVGARMTYTKANVFSTYVDFPAVSSANVRAANNPIYLQGLQHDGGAGILTDLGIFNLGTAAASCTLDLHAGNNGAVLAAGVPFSIPALSSQFLPDVFGETGTAPALPVPADSWAKIVCNQSFWAFGIRLNGVTGKPVALLPVEALVQSTLVQGGMPPLPPGATLLLERRGTFLIYPDTTNPPFHNVRYPFNGGGVEFKRLTLEFDVYVHRWDPSPKKAHCLFWLNSGTGWGGMMGYQNAMEGQGVMRFSVNYNISKAQDKGPITQLGRWYRVSYWLDTHAASRSVGYQIFNSTESGQVGAIFNPGVSFTHSRTGIPLSGGFIELGYQKSDGPEAKTPGWKWANMRILGYVN